MELLHHLETQLERQIPAQLQTTLQQARDDCQLRCDQCRLAMHRHCGGAGGGDAGQRPL